MATLTKTKKKPAVKTKITDLRGRKQASKVKAGMLSVTGGLAGPEDFSKP